MMVSRSHFSTKHKRFGLAGNSNHSETLIAIAMIAGLISTCGCSGVLTDSMTGNLLADRSILPLEDSIEQPVLDPDPGSSLEDLNTDADTELAVDSSISTDVNADEKSDAQQQKQGFRFSQDLPNEIVPTSESNETDSSASSSTTPNADLALPNLDSETVRPEITLVARTQPVAATKTAEAQPIDTELEFKAIKPDKSRILSPLKPVNLEREPSIAKPANQVDIETEALQLSSSDLRQLTRSAIETPIMSAHQSIDLTELELESNLLQDQPESKPLTASNHLSKTIQLLKESAEDPAVQDGHPGTNVSVRMLEMLQEKLDDPSASEWSLSDKEHEYWQQQLHAVAVMFKADTEHATNESIHQRQQTALRAIEHLDKASHHLREMAGLRIHGGQLCSEISGFGQYRELDSSRFQPGDRALVYIEVDNFSSQQIDSKTSHESENNTQWVTRLQTNYTILDSAGQVVQRETYPVIEDVANQRRHNFYLHLPLTITDLPPGDYQLAVVVEDLANSNSATLQRVVFSVAN